MARTNYNYAAMNSKAAATRMESGLLNEPLLWKCMLLIGLTYLIWSEKLSIVLDFSPVSGHERFDPNAGQRIKASLLPEIPLHPQPSRAAAPKAAVRMPAGARGHIPYVVDPGFAERNGIGSAQASNSLQRCRMYIDRFAPVAEAEMKKFGMPASIILAQGLLESNAGDSELAQVSNNHFGIKCFSNRCKKGHCVNFNDDSHKDFFVKYSNVWSSYRAHSNFLKNSRRYSHLFRLAPDDYQGWAKGLARAGYATDKKYAEKLIAIIQNLQLYRYDRS